MDQDNTLGTLSRVANPGVQPVAQSGESNIANKADSFVSTSVLAQGRVSQKVKGRDRRVDFFRGLALLMIFIDHVPGNMLSSFTLWNFGLCDAAEVFVLLAGISASLAFGALYERTYWRAATARVLMRCWDLYVVHIVLFCIVAAVVVSATRYFDNPFYLEQVNLLPLFADTERALVYALTLGYQPDFLDILPLYCVLLAFVPVSVPICILKPWVMLVPSGALYLLIQFWPFNLPNYPGETGWYFNPFAWQLLFVIGLVIGTFRRRNWVVGDALRRILLIASMLYVAAAFAVAAPWRHIPGLEEVVVVPWSWLPPLSKTDLSIFRLLNILALTCLAALAMHSENRLLLQAFGRFCILLGRHSLPVFAIGIIASTLGNVWFMEVGRGLISQVIVNALGFGAMLSVAWLVSWLKARPWDIRKASATWQTGAQERR
jgi:hypothetical protein